jgi:hypothetical protein
VNDDETIYINTKGLDQLIKALNGSIPHARVGILGDKNSRDGKANSNATVGAAHEFGTSSLPIRSFLRVPISENLQRYLEKAGAFTPEAFALVLKQKSLMPWMRKIAVLAESIVADAFDSGGFGKWTPSNMDYKKNHQTLVETQQLRNSVTSEVKE